MTVNWKDNVKARKDYQCHCCCGPIAKGEKHFVESEWGNTMYPMVRRYCSQCGPFIKQGLSFRETRIKAFGSPLLRGWIYPRFMQEKRSG